MKIVKLLGLVSLMSSPLMLPFELKAEGMYTADCISEAYRALSSSQAAEVCLNATPYTASCVTEAYRSLSSNQTVQVCRNATASTGECVTKVYRSLSSNQTVEACLPSPPQNSEVQSRRSFRITNSTGYRIEKLYLSPSDRTNWGNDVLGNSTLSSGYQKDFTLSNRGCLYDIQAELSNGRKITSKQVNTCDYTSFTFQ